jgi:hypothetical protein
VRRHPPKPIGPLARWNGKPSRTNRAEEWRWLRGTYPRCPREALCPRRHNRPPSIPGEPPARGTEGSNLVPSSGESPANLSFRRIEVQGRSREADGDSRGGEHQGCAAVQQLTASPAADATESNVSLARPEPLYECAAAAPKEDFGDMANGESRTGRQCGVGRQRGNDKEPTCRATSPKGNGCRRVHR